ncbi:MAG: hypothetical protein H6719_23525 [Sandaracinaceae bacterium]|nr:hypothetical protein [Sandaracinaceae bacterium]
MDVLTLKGLGPRDRGRAHGEHFRSRIHEIARIRVDLALAQGKLGSEAALLEVCRKHLPVLAAFDHALHDELLGIAEGADLDPTRVVCLNHYTDLKDIADEECTSAAAMTPDGPVFGQTWDMHGSVEPYVCVLELDGLNAFSITGCLALAGLNDAGLGVCINNLKSHDARVGVVWPALVRRMLREPNAEAALHVLMTAPMSSGHHYLFADASRAYAVETSGERKQVVLDRRFEGELSYIHTNHCLSPEIEAVSWVGETSTTHERFAWLDASVKARPIASRRDLWERLGSHDGYPRSLCTHLATEQSPQAMKTCGAVVMDPVRKELWACQGCVNGAEPVSFTFEEA